MHFKIKISEHCEWGICDPVGPSTAWGVSEADWGMEFTVGKQQHHGKRTWSR